MLSHDEERELIQIIEEVDRIYVADRIAGHRSWVRDKLLPELARSGWVIHKENASICVRKAGFSR